LTVPKPGRRVRGSHSGRPIMALFDLLGRRWAMRLIWILRERPLLFRELQAACDQASSSVIARRLAELKDAGIVASAADGYVLTEEGRILLDAYGPLGAWAERWARRVATTKRKG
jgi:DNA-binding HxlR family transcriptional regulator